MNLSPHFALAEFIASQHREIDNTPPPELLPALQRTALGLEQIRFAIGFPIIISSGYRCPELNEAVGGQPNSQHVKGEAADFICPQFGTPAEVAAFLAPKIANLGIDQMILEFGRWVHVSFATRPRQMALTIRSKEEGYVPGVVA